MTPGARVAAAIELLQEIDDGLAAEQALTRWARRSRFAGSKDRAAIRDHVFDVLRCFRSAAHAGGAETPRARMAGLLALQGQDLPALFSGDGHAPAPLGADEAPHLEASEDLGARWDLPDWLVPLFQDSLGDDAERTAIALRARAPVSLRVNVQRTDLQQARASLAQDGVAAQENPLCPTALSVTEGSRKIRQSTAYVAGLVELQDAASQAVVAAVPAGEKVLDYCAGGGGKALALAAQPDRAVFAHDHAPERMRDLPARAARAQVTVTQVDRNTLRSLAPFDVVLCDVPCSGAGSWRRAPQGKWQLTPDRLTELEGIQDRILEDCADLLSAEGTLVYATCSVLRCENEARIAAFLERHPDWHCGFERRYSVTADGDGFYNAHLTRQ